MATQNIETLQEELPEVFDEREPPVGWDDFELIPSGFDNENPLEPDLIEAGLTGEMISDDFQDSRKEGVNDEENVFTTLEGVEIPEIESVFPGSPQKSKGSVYPPPDALAFYLPFHYYYPELWGIYLIVEGIEILATFLRKHSNWNLTAQKAVVVARLFLYYHEAFHHNVESFATRLEVTHRQPLYRFGFQHLYNETLGTDGCLEEALANAYAYRKVYSALDSNNRRKRAVLSGLRAYIEGQPPGYKRALKFIDDDPFREARDAFAEDNYAESLRRARLDDSIWRLHAHGFRGIAQINSHTNYLIHKNSRLKHRVDFGGRRLSYRKLKKKLKRRVGLEFERQGRGSHEVYRTDEGNRVTLYQTTGDVPKGTISNILKQAGIDMTVHDFIRS